MQVMRLLLTVAMLFRVFLPARGVLANQIHLLVSYFFASPTRVLNFASTFLISPSTSLEIFAEMSFNIPHSFDALQTSEQVQLLDTVDALRTCGLDGILALPQLVVCGDQSSGKSSVLEAITEIPFPRKENLCTRFTTELVLRRSKVVRITAQIIPDKERSHEEQSALTKQLLSLSDFSKLPDLIDEATKIMGLDDPHKKRAFSRDVLRIIIEGPDRPALTLVDLPGVIHSENKSQTAEDVQVISKLVDHYISNPRTIILAVVSAMNDAANQVILKRAKEHDPNGRRTLGIITKPDTLHAGSESEDAFITLALNMNIFFERGWHVLRGRAFAERDVSFAERNTIEADFFSKGRWLELDPDTIGIDALRTRLSELLFIHVKQELPTLRMELETARAENTKLLLKLGDKRASLSEQRQFLTKISTSFRDTCKAAVDGHYDLEHFGEDVDISGGSQAAVRRLRALIQKRHIEYANVLRVAGHKYNTVKNSAGRSSKPVKRAVKLGEVRVTFVQHDMSPAQLLGWAKKVLSSNRGREMVGSYNPMLVGELFRVQSQNWQLLTEQHLANVASDCSRFCTDLLRTICPKDNVSSQLNIVIKDALKSRVKNAEDELIKLIRDKNRPPQTFNHYLTLTVQMNRRRRLSESKALPEKRPKADNAKTFSQLAAQGVGVPTWHTWEEAPTSGEEEPASGDSNAEIGNCIMDMDEYSCLDALDYLSSYYKVYSIIPYHKPPVRFSKSMQANSTYSITGLPQNIHRQHLYSMLRTTSNRRPGRRPLPPQSSKFHRRRDRSCSSGTGARHEEETDAGGEEGESREGEGCV
jgi:GTPase SAR1 family protein